MSARSITIKRIPPIRLLALDLDGTLAVDRHDVSPATRTALTELREAEGVEIVICSGRRYRGTQRVIANLGWGTHTICNGGALIKDPGQRTIHSAAMAPHLVRELVSVAHAHGLALVGQRDSHDLGGPDFVIDDAIEWNGATRGYFDDNREYASAAPMADEDDPGPFLVLGAFGDHADLGRMAAEVGQRYGRDLTTVIVPSVLTRSWHCQIGLADVDKWSALKLVARALEIPVASVCAVGDELNDVPMILGAGVGVAMADGHPELQRVADWVCGRHDEDGILEVVEFIRNRNGT